MERIRITHNSCKHLRSCISLTVVLARLSSFAAFASSESKTKGLAASRGNITGRLQQETNTQDPNVPEMYVGEGARLRAQQLRSTNKAIARAMKELESRGMSPKWDQSLTVFQTRSDSTTNANGEALKKVSYPQTWVDGSYELTLITYSSSNSQWEGIIYLHNPNEDDT